MKAGFDVSYKDNREPDQKVQVIYMRTTTYWKSTQRYYSLQAGKNKMGLLLELLKKYNRI